MEPTNRRCFQVAMLALMAMLAGCRGHQFGHIIEPDQQDMVGSHSAGAATFNPLVEEAVGKLLARQVADPHAPPLGKKRICFVGIENYSAEEMVDFKEQLYEEIDAMIVGSEVFSPVSRRYVEAGLKQTRLRPDSLFLPENMQLFSATLADQGQPFDYLLFGKLTSGTTQKNRDTQRDYQLSLELIDVQTGDFDKEQAKIRKGYHHTRLGKLRNYNPFTRW